MTDHPRYEPIALNPESTVVAEFAPDSSQESGHQSEAGERAFIKLLEGQAYEYLPIPGTAALEANLRAALEALNKLTFTDAEWHLFFSERSPAATTGSSRRPRASRRTASRC